MRLSHKDFDALQHAILKLHDYHDMETLRRDVPRIFHSVERDRLMLNLIRPHYDQACRNIRFVEALSAAGPVPRPAAKLTPRETEVAGWLAQGKTNPEIAILLAAKVRTIEKHMERVLEKLGTENRTAAALMVARCLRPNSPGGQPPARPETD
jgi:DNA-binding CsgD family transcriptional regulator